MLSLNKYTQIQKSRSFNLICYSIFLFFATVSFFALDDMDIFIYSTLILLPVHYIKNEHLKLILYFVFIISILIVFQKYFTTEPRKTNLFLLGSSIVLWIYGFAGYLCARMMAKDTAKWIHMGINDL